MQLHQIILIHSEEQEEFRKMQLNQHFHPFQGARGVWKNAIAPICSSIPRNKKRSEECNCTTFSSILNDHSLLKSQNHKKWNSSYYIHNLEKAKNPRIQHARRDILHRGGGLSHQSMRAVLVGSTIWHTQYPQKMNLGVLNVWWIIVFQEKDIFLCILMEECIYFLHANYKL